VDNKIQYQITHDPSLFEAVNQIGSFFNDPAAPDLEWLNIRYGLFRDCHLKGAMGTDHYEIIIFPGDNILNFLAALRTGEINPATLKIDFNHDSTPSA